jgi:hypothetical protein
LNSRDYYFNTFKKMKHLIKAGIGIVSLLLVCIVLNSSCTGKSGEQNTAASESAFNFADTGWQIFQWNRPHRLAMWAMTATENGIIQPTGTGLLY